MRYHELAAVARIFGAKSSLFRFPTASGEVLVS